MKKMTNALKNYIVDAALLIALGLVMLIWPQYSLKIIFTWTGIGLLATGAVKAAIYFAKKNKENRRAASLLAGLLQIAGGIFAIVKAGFLAEHFPVAAGLLLGYGAMVMILRALRLKSGSSKAFPLCFGLGLISLVLAVVVFVQPALLAGRMIQTAGVSMIVEGIALLIVLAQKEK